MRINLHHCNQPLPLSSLWLVKIAGHTCPQSKWKSASVVCSFVWQHLQSQMHQPLNIHVQCPQKTQNTLPMMATCPLRSSNWLPMLLLAVLLSHGAVPKGFSLHWAVPASHSHPAVWVGHCSVPDCWPADSRAVSVHTVLPAEGEQERWCAPGHGIGGKEDPVLETRVFWRRVNIELMVQWCTHPTGWCTTRKKCICSASLWSRNHYRKKNKGQIMPGLSVRPGESNYQLLVVLAWIWGRL